MASLTDICEGIAANLQDITGVQWSAYMLNNPTAPYGEVYPGNDEGVLTKYDTTFGRGTDWWLLTVRVRVPFTSDIAAQQNLYRYIESSGALSVKEALEQDTTLGGACDDLRVESCSGVGMSKDGSQLGCEWQVRVIAPG